MPLCGNYRCGCGISAGTGITITGSGQDGDPWVISTSTPPTPAPPPVTTFGPTTLKSWIGPLGTTATDVTGLTLSFTAVSGRSYELIATVALKLESTYYKYGVANVYLTTSSGGVVKKEQVSWQTDYSYVYTSTSRTEVEVASASLRAIVTPGAGTVTYKVRASAVSSVSRIFIGGDNEMPATLLARYL